MSIAFHNQLCIEQVRLSLKKAPHVIEELLLQFTGVIQEAREMSRIGDDGILFVPGAFNPPRYSDLVNYSSEKTELILRHEPTLAKKEEIVLVADSFIYYPLNSHRDSKTKPVTFRGKYWTLQNVTECILKAEIEFRQDDGFDTHIYWEGLKQTTDGSYYVCWGS